MLSNTPPEQGSDGSPGDVRAEEPAGTAVTAWFSSWVERRKWWLAPVWLALLVAAGASGASLPSQLTGAGWSTDEAESTVVASALSQGFHGRGEATAVLVVHDRRHTSADSAFERRVRDVFSHVRSDPELRVTSSYGWSTLEPANRADFLGQSEATAITYMGMDVDDRVALELLPRTSRALAGRYADEGLDVWLVSPEAFWGEMNRQGNEGLVTAELIALPVIILVLLLLFRSVVAAVTSLAVGVTAVLGTLGVLSPIAQQYEMSIFVQNIATMLGLGVGVDYSLFMIKRFKEQLASGQDVTSAVSTTLHTAGRTVVFSGITIIAAMSTLFVVNLTAIRSIAIGAISVVVFAMISSVLLLPVLLHLLGARINSGRVWVPRRWRGRESSDDERLAERGWHRWTCLVMRFPWRFLIAGFAPLILLSLLAPQMKLFMPDARILAGDNVVRAGFDKVQEEFGPGATSPIQVLVSSGHALHETRDAAEIVDLARHLRDLPGVAEVHSALPTLRAVVPPRQFRSDPFAVLATGRMTQLPSDVRATLRHYIAKNERATILEVIPSTHASDAATTRLLNKVRDRVDQLPASLQAAVGGQSALGDEASTLIAKRIPWLIALMLTVVYIVLSVTFRSVFLPLKAIALNLLSVSATYGVMVVVFQDGWGTELLGFDHTGYVMFFVPVLLLAMLFSLGTDYEVFVLGRVREEYLACGDNNEAVARGMARMAPLISGAALLMVVVFGAFAFAGIVPVQQLGFGLAVAVALDATVVRGLLVPAAMRLMQEWNWWWPGQTRARPAGAADRRPVASLVRVLVIAGLAARWVCLACAMMLAAHVSLTVAEANPNNLIAATISNGADVVVVAFQDLFLPDDPKLRVLMNYGAAALFWLLMSHLASRLLAGGQQQVPPRGRGVERAR